MVARLAHRAAPLVLGVLVSVALGACGSDEPSTPAACLGEGRDYLRALEAAPAAVTLDDGTPIGDCIVEGQEPAALAGVGASTIEAATRLNVLARRDPGGEASVRLGYLVGAVQEAASGTGGIHADLVRRLDAAARFNPGGEPLPASFERAFGTGYAAGQR
jgi:hypothetical protein